MTIKEIEQEFDEKFVDKEGCQKGGKDCGKKADISGQYFCDTCEKWGGMEGEPKDWKRPITTSKQIKSFYSAKITEMLERIRLNKEEK